ncbi:hypothetical protein D047_5024B, partial [Vibrio parahaemolyticus VPTS-2010_2]
MDIAV